MYDKIKELTLLLLYLTSLEEDELYKYRRSWKGYDFEALDDLKNEGFIDGSNRSKSVYFTDEGVKKAQELMSIYFKDFKLEDK